MSLYNMLFGMNPQTNLLLAVIGLRRSDIERFRDVYVNSEGTQITVHSRTGGGNRGDYPNNLMRKMPGWTGSVDDDFDSTYCNDTFTVPEKFVKDVCGLNDLLANGIRKPFGKHLLKTLRREKTESDLAAEAYEIERSALSKTNHQMANGHTFVPLDDSAMRVALTNAEANGGELRSCWGIAPLVISVKRNEIPYPNAMHERDRTHMNRVKIAYAWQVDRDYWQHCVDVFTAEFPKAMDKIAVSVGELLKGERSKA